MAMGCYDKMPLFQEVMLTGIVIVIFVLVSFQHITVHINRSAIVNSISDSLGHYLLAGVRRKTKNQETRLRGGQPVNWL